MKSTYLTTPLYYVNDVPHIGHAYTTIAADVLARWGRLKGEDVFFLTGTDEHGQKIAVAAESKGETPKAYVDRIAGEFRRLWTVLNISNDDFIQTTEERHTKVVQAVFEKLKESGDIYKGSYEDWYCVHDESYFSESELVDKKCPSCGREVQRLKEDSYFFRLSKYEKPLLEHFEKNPGFLSPKFRASEIINFVKSGLRDLSVSRTRVKWGVQVPFDPEHVVYVWFDALLNYISAPGYDPKAAAPAAPFTDRWPADVHLVGKEIFRFHAVIWPAMLMALGVPLPKKVFAHGWWTVEGQKMSKSLGNVVDPHTMAEEYGVDAFRYFLLREVNFGSDGDFSEKALLTRYNSELANNIGNLLQRTITLTVKNLNGEAPPLPEKSKLIPDPSNLYKRLSGAYGDLAFSEALQTIYDMVVKTNQFIDVESPWSLSAEQKDKIQAILAECFVVLKTITVLYHPFMPEKTLEMWGKLGEKNTLLNEAAGILAGLEKGKLPSFQPGQKVEKGNPLFMRKGGRWK